MESELRSTSVKRKKKKKRELYEDEAKPHSLTSIRNSHSKDTDDSSENATLIDKGRAKEDTERSFRIFDTSRSKKFSNAGSTDLEEFHASRSMDVVVDIHREYNVNKHRDEIEEIGAIPAKESPRESESFKVFSKTNASRGRRRIEAQRLKIDSSQSLKEEHDDIEVIESLDLIEEFQEETTTKERSNKDTSQSLEGKPSRRQWSMPESRIEEPKKPPRRRWSKDTSVIRLPESKSISWTISSKKEKPLIRGKPSAATRTSKQNLSGIDNAAFMLENEEILRIETDYNQQDTRIEMTEISNELGTKTNDRSSRKSLVQGKVEETILINQNGFKDSIVQSVEERTEAIVDIESIEDASTKQEKGSRNEIKSTEENGERDSDESSDSKSLEEVTARSSRSSEETLTKDQLRLKRGKIPRRSLTDDETRSDQRTISTTEDDLEEETNDEGSTKAIAKRRKSKQREKKKSVRQSVSSSSVHTEDSKKKKKGTKYISITIHRADMLEIDYVTKHPMVKVHIMDAEIGKYLKSDQGTHGYLQPMITGKFDFKENRSIVPVWEEELIFEHNFDALLKTENEQVVILFEIVDLLSFAEASFNYDRFGHERCWYKVAWAFLRPVGKSNILHVNKKVRLQLYKPQKTVKKFERFHTCEVYTWWKSSKREKYPSSLFVTVAAIDPPKLEPVFYQQLSLHDLSEVLSEVQKASARTSDSINLPKWTRLAAQSCKIPNESVFETDVSENGSFFVAFSNDGKYLACTLSEERDYPIVVYEIKEKEVLVRFSGHSTFVYSLNWSENDNYLLSVSSDQTARIWDVQNQIIQYVEMMPHPSYVYCGKFAPGGTAIVATGCYDRIARIWIKNRKLKNRDLIQELEGHGGFINSMCFQKNSNLLTADSVGVIIVWTVKKSRRESSRKEWHISRKIRVKEIDSVIINTIVLHPLESRLLVHSRNNELRMLDLATGVVLRKYHDLNNQRIQTTACVSPCGGLIFCGGEDSSLNVWNLETGTLLAKYILDRNFRAVTCVDYHPYDHVLAYSTFGSPAPVRILRFNKDATGDDVGLKLMGETDNKVDDNVPLKPLNSIGTSRERSRSNSRTPEEASKERGLQYSRSQRLNPVESFGSIFSEKDDKYTDTRLKLRRLNETEQTLKNRSANRLYNIIEKIDRILSNTSRSSGDVESGRNFSYTHDMGDISGEQNIEIENEKGKKRNKPAYLNAGGDHSSLYFDSSTGNNTSKGYDFELKTQVNMRASNWNTKKRSKSAKQRRSKEYEDDALKVLSDSATNYHKIKVYNDTETTSPKTLETSFIIQAKDNNATNLYYNKGFNKDYSNSSDSAGTYVVEKNSIENSDEDSVKFLGSKDLIKSDTGNYSNNAKHSGSESSVPSNATFTVENEIPVPKPRRKKNLT
ncbi:uncharacterized protein LOC143187167 [Calliopsis andreniformis]|uniref:uncharacterized protein LOC143187167 n=1 Tax=Calliopsis andreniformis TaxID=337506 RepID=UPI003FCDBC9F